MFMLTTQEADVLIAISKKRFNSQRDIAGYTGHALGMVNKAIKALKEKMLIEMKIDSFGKQNLVLTDKGKALLKENKPKNAIILAAGFGMRMVPINLETPKALLSINGERLIERIIKQLNEVGIKGDQIHIVVGFMKEKFEYLMDQYGVDLIVNRNYTTHNNISSLALAGKYIDNTYIIPSDVWCDYNPFSTDEIYSWYMVSDEIDDNSEVRVNRKNELVKVKNKAGNAMIGISYLCGDIGGMIRKRIDDMSQNKKYDDSFWEKALYGRIEDNESSNRMIIQAKVVHSSDVVEINTYEQLRDLDNESEALQSDAIYTIAKVFNCKPEEISNINVLKKGMTNRSFLFTVKSEKYIMRIPGEGTDKLINRKQEADVYQALSGKGLCDDPVYINPSNGYKITKFLENVRSCDSRNDDDLIKCMNLLRKFHGMHLKVSHTFDIFEQIKFYQKLWNGEASMYVDHERTTENVFKLKQFIEMQDKNWCLTHIDAVPDNFLFYKDNPNDEEKLQLTDWEYAGMQDPHVDIAMFCIYSLYDKKQVDHLIDLYFKGNCDKNTRTKIYCYIAACGLLWSNWCEYKAQLGVEFGEYSLRQYRFAKDYYRYAIERM